MKSGRKGDIERQHEGQGNVDGCGTLARNHEEKQTYEEIDSAA